MILLTLRNMNGDVLGFYRIKSFKDLKEVYKDFPNTEDVAAEAENLEDAANNISEYLSSHNMDCEVNLDAEEGSIPDEWGVNSEPKGYWQHIKQAKFDDGWDQAKHDRGGDKDLQEYLTKLNAKYDTNPTDSLKKADKKKEQKQPITDQILSTISKNSSNYGYNLHPEQGDDYKFDINGTQRVADPKDKLAALYRAYKASPHHPLSVALKYAIHRIENRDAYSNATPEERDAMDKGFIDVHTRGGAKSKNGHLEVSDLHKWIRDNASVIPALLDHQKYVQDSIRKHAPWVISKIDGEEHIPLFRGLNVDKHLRGVDHALSSYSDLKGTAEGFGQYVHKHMVPLKNLWFSYDIGPSDSFGGMGTENEFLVSPHDIKYANNNKEGEKIFSNSVGDLTNNSNVREMNRKRWNNGCKGYINSLSENQFLDALEETPPDFLWKVVKGRNNLSDEGFDRFLNMSKKIDPDGVNTIEPYLTSHPDLPESHIKKATQSYDRINTGLLSHRSGAYGEVHPNWPQELNFISNPDRLAEAVKKHNTQKGTVAIVRAISDNPHITTEHLNKLLDSVDFDPRSGVLHVIAEHPEANQEVINKVYNKIPNKFDISREIIQNTSNPEHLNKLIHRNMDMFEADLATHNKNISKEQLDTAANRMFDIGTPEPRDLIALANHPKVTLNHLQRIANLQPTNDYVEKAQRVATNHPIYQEWQMQEQQKQNDAIKNAEPNLKKSLQNIKEVVDMISNNKTSQGIPQSLMKEITENLHLLKMMLGYLILTTQKEKLESILSEMDKQDEVGNQAENPAPSDQVEDNIACKTPAYDDPHMDNAFAANNIRQNTGDATPLTPFDSPGTPEALERLAEFATTKKEGEVWYYLLHRGTVNYEHEDSATDDGNWFETTEETEWVPEYMEGERDQKGVNPVVSCWIDEGRIIKVLGAQENNGTWGELGKNPHAHEYRVVVAPGKYKIYSELKV